MQLIKIKAGEGISMQQITTQSSRISDLQKLGPFGLERIELTFYSVSSLFLPVSCSWWKRKGKEYLPE